ncbi:MAG TPA: hypothetical protein VHW02_12830 [Rhizomicrobium sp.]|jgi:hypothetical protein|nr:hypothetical protein [Rhizomicrobium sp.]
MKCFLPLVALIFAWPLCALATATDMTGVSKCDLKGFSTDNDPKGSNIRSAPNANASVIGHVPAEMNLPGGEDTVSASFDIIGSKDGWLLVRNVDAGGAAGGTDYKIVFKGPGWISGALAGFTVGSSELRSAPSKTSPIVVTLTDEKNGIGADSYAVKRVHACQGTFADITVQPPDSKAKPVRGWAAKVCRNQVTTCDPY